MTSHYIEEVIREEIRKIIEDMNKSSYLSEEDEEAPAAETPAEEPPKEEEKPAEEKPKEEEPKEEEKPAEEKPKEEEPKEEEKPAEEGGDDKEKKEEKPKEEETPTGLKTVDLVSPVEAYSWKKKSTSISPQSQEKLLSYDYEEILDAYDLNLSKKDDEEAKSTLKKIAKKVQAIAITKSNLISKKVLDTETTLALQYYYKNTKDINELVRSQIELDSEKEIRKQLKMGKPKKDDTRMPEYMNAMQGMTVYNLDFAFREELQRLDFNIVVYRTVESDDVLQKLLSAGTWIDNGYVSTSLNPLVADGMEKKRLPLFEMLIPAGSSVLALPCKINDYCHETEITLPRSCKFTIHGYNETRNIYKILVEQNNA